MAARTSRFALQKSQAVGALPSRHGVQDFLLPDDSYDPRSTRFLRGYRTFADILKANGYTCGLAGKWRLGRDEQARAGFDYWRAAPRGGGPYKDTEFFVNGKSVKNTGYKTDFVGDGAVDFIGKNHARPFCLVVPFFAPHSPYDYQPEKYRRHYADAEFSCFPRPAARRPQRRGRFERRRGNRETYAAYSALVTGVDANVGRIIDKLDELGIRENTVVVFSAGKPSPAKTPARIFRAGRRSAHRRLALDDPANRPQRRRLLPLERGIEGHATSSLGMP